MCTVSLAEVRPRTERKLILIRSKDILSVEPSTPSQYALKCRYIYTILSVEPSTPSQYALKCRYIYTISEK
jgi:hypothetical protein